MAAILAECGALAVSSLANGPSVQSEGSSRSCVSLFPTSWQSPCSARSRRGLGGQVLLWRPRAAASNNAAVAPATMSLSDFAEQEATKFQEEFLKLLQAEGASLESGEKVAAVCSEVLQKYAASYSGTIEPEPFAEMKSRLDQAGLPSEKPILTAIGWVRTNLYNDWKRWSK